MGVLSLLIGLVFLSGGLIVTTGGRDPALDVLAGLGLLWLAVAGWRLLPRIWSWNPFGD